MTEKEHKRFRFILNVLYVAIILGLIFFFLKFVFFWISPFIIAFGVCFLIEPLIRFLCTKCKFKRALASGLVVTALLALLVALAWLLSGTILKEIRVVFRNLSDYLDVVRNFIETIPTKYGKFVSFMPDKYIDSALEFLKQYDYSSVLSGTFGKGLVSYAGSFLTSLPSMIVYIIVLLVSTYFTAASFPTIKTFILRQFSPKVREVVLDAKQYFFSTIVKYLKSYALLMLITFTELSVSFLIFGFKPAITLALIIAVVDILPVLGVGTVLIPWSVIELILGNPVRALILICIYLVIAILRQILEPKIIGDHVGLMPIVTLFCIYLGLQLFGVLGMFLLPITVIVLKNLQDSGKIKIWK